MLNGIGVSSDAQHITGASKNSKQFKMKYFLLLTLVCLALHIIEAKKPKVEPNEEEDEEALEPVRMQKYYYFNNSRTI